MRHYYSYRCTSGEDPRLLALPSSLLDNVDVLDVGCHEALFSLSLARFFHPRHVHGVDIDPSLVKRAVRNMASLVRHHGKHIFNQTQFTFASIDFTSRLDQQQQHHNHQHHRLCHKHSYDTLLMMSVLKWVQLNGGDAALHRCLCNAWHVLRPGGSLVLEIQPLKSYRKALKKHRLPQDMRENFSSISIVPNNLVEYATQSIGFEYAHTLRSASNSGFDRDIVALRKPYGTDDTDNQNGIHDT